MPPPRTTVLIFARAPVPGRCKTRLIGRLGARGAARIYRALALRAIAAACALPGARVELWCEPSTRHGFFLRCRRDFRVRLRRQGAGDLGRKMALALTRTLAAGAQAALLIGSDCAALSAADLAAARDDLARGEVVLQPADDGGYVLIGARRFAAGALRGIGWSSGRELRQTVTRLRRCGLDHRLRPTLWDVDLPRDVRRAKRAGLL